MLREAWPNQPDNLENYSENGDGGHKSIVCTRRHRTEVPAAMGNTYRPTITAVRTEKDDGVWQRTPVEPQLFVGAPGNNVGLGTQVEHQSGLDCPRRKQLLLPARQRTTLGCTTLRARRSSAP